ncbi:MFS transporter [Actinomycetota bacterium]
MTARVAPWLRVALAMFGVGWGANQFAPMVLAYRQQDGLSESSVTLMFAMYAAGLIPALLVSARVSTIFGHRSVLRPMMVLSVLASLMLIAGKDHEWALFAGRFMAGVASGAVFAPGTAWVRELSASAPAGTGARRAAIALSSGFGGGPLVAGTLAQWGPHPQVLPYVAHLLVMAVVTPLVWRAPETADEHHLTLAPHGALHTIFSAPYAAVLVPVGPWVFGSAALGFVTVPSFVADKTAGIAIALSGFAAALGLGTGVAIQPRVRRMEAHRPGSALPLGMLLSTAGLLTGAATAATHQVALVAPAAALLGAAYGMVLTGGLMQVERLAHSDTQALLNAVFYAVTYVGFIFPFLAAILARRFGPVEVMLGGAAVTVLTALWAGGMERRYLRHSH